MAFHKSKHSMFCKVIATFVSVALVSTSTLQAAPRNFFHESKLAPKSDSKSGYPEAVKAYKAIESKQAESSAAKPVIPPAIPTPGTHMTIPKLPGQPVSSAEETNGAIRKELHGRGIRILQPDGTWVLRNVFEGKGVINTPLLPAAGLIDKVHAAKLLLGDVAKEMENIPARVDRDELVRRAQNVSYGFPRGYTIGKDVLAHAGRTYNCVYIGEEMAMDEDISAKDLARVMLEDALHFTVEGGDPEHKVIKHGDPIKKKLVSVVMRKSSMAREIAIKMALLTNRSSVADVLALPVVDIAAKATVGQRLKCIFLTMSPDIVNLHEEITKRARKEGVIIIPVYDKKYAVPFDYVNDIAKKYPNIFMKPVDVETVQSESANEPLGVAAVMYANRLLREKRITTMVKDIDVGWLNASDETYRIKGIVSDRAKILEVTPQKLSTDPASKEIHHIGSLLGITEVGVLLHQQLGEKFETMTIADLAGYIDNEAIRKAFAGLLGITEDEAGKVKVADFIKAPMPLATESDIFKTNYDAMREIMTAA